ncbi:MAG TPA: FtsX-like permease family protein [Ktedonobacteraceae bacterium]
MMRRSQWAGLWQRPGTFLEAALTLAVWRWRAQRALLLFAGVGILCAVVLVGALPLFSSVMTTAGLRDVLRAQSNSAQIIATAGLQGLSSREVANATELADKTMRKDVGGYLTGNPQKTVITGNWYLNRAGFTMNFYGVPMQTVSPHLRLLRGRLPTTSSASTSTIEIMLTQTAASELDVDIGGSIPLAVLLLTKQAKNDIGAPDGPVPYVNQLSAIVVGIFQVQASDAYWDGYTLEAPALDAREIPPPFLGLTDQAVLLKMLDIIAQQHHAAGIFFSDKSFDSVYLSYTLNASLITGYTLHDLITRLGGLQQDANQTFQLVTHPGEDVNIIGITLAGLVLHDLNGPGTLEKYRSQEEIVQAPALILTAEIMGLLLFFVSVIIGALVEREQLTIAVMRSRGSSRLQVTASLLIQTLGLCLGAGLLGPLLALGLTYVVVPPFLSASNRDAFNVLVLEPGQVVRALSSATGSALVVALLSLLAVIVLVVRSNILTRRQEEARSTVRPLWYRQRLDLAVAVLALIGYLLILYLQHAQQYLSAQGQILVSTPLELLAPLLLVLAGILFFLRLFPLCLRLLIWLARSARGLPVMLALVQMERTPRPSMRMALLLGLTTAFVFFSLVFSASQNQRGQDLATYQAVSDFGGYTRALPSTTPDDAASVLSQASLFYRKVRGVTSVTVGYVDNRYLLVSGDTAQAYMHKALLTAVDADTFARTAFWSSQDSDQSLANLMGLLSQRRQEADRRGVVPAIVAASTWQMLGLTPGMTFRLADNLGQFDSTVYMAVAEVRHIPPTDDGVQGALLVDYQSLVVGRARYQELTRPNYIWLRISDTSIAVNQVRAALANPELALNDLVDRRAISSSNAINPLARSLLSILSVGVVAALLLALLANFLLPLLRARERQTNFAVLRALGTPSVQITRLLAWEMVIILVTALLLGLLFGWLLIATSVAPLVFTGELPGNLVDVSSTALYTLQQLIPVTIVVPSSVFGALLVMTALCLLAVGITTRLVQRPFLAQALLIDDD